MREAIAVASWAFLLTIYAHDINLTSFVHTNTFYCLGGALAEAISKLAVRHHLEGKKLLRC